MTGRYYAGHATGEHKQQGSGADADGCIIGQANRKSKDDFFLSISFNLGVGKFLVQS
jgi:hypothetical protein